MSSWELITVPKPWPAPFMEMDTGHMIGYGFLAARGFWVRGNNHLPQTTCFFQLLAYSLNLPAISQLLTYGYGWHQIR